MTIFCTNCGNPLGEQVQFCPECGTKKAQVIIPDENKQSTEPEMPPDIENTDDTEQQQINLQPKEYQQPPFPQPVYNPPPPGMPQPDQILQGQANNMVQKSSSNKILIIASCVAAVVLIVSLALVFTFRDAIFGFADTQASDDEPLVVIPPQQVQNGDVQPGDDNPQSNAPPNVIVDDNWRGAELNGNWYSGSGATIYYLWNTEEVTIYVTGDGAGRIYDDTGEWGDWHIDDDGVMWIEGEEYMTIYGIVNLTYSLNNDTVTFTDSDGDSRSYSRTRR